jgi:oligopeptide transport system substrate-binding protein
MFTANSAYNWTGWKHADYEQLLDTAALTPDAQQRFELLQRAEAVLLADSPVAPLHVGAQTYLLHPAVQGWEPAPLIFRRFQLVRLATPSP